MNEKMSIALFSSMLRIRRVEQKIAEYYSDEEMRCPVHLSVGQEATAVGACSALAAKDIICSTHRSHAHYLAKGGDLQAMLAEIYGRATGCCGGRGGSMHLFDKEAGVLASVPIVGSTIPIGVGAALTFVQLGSPRVSLIFLGDAATEEGVFHESMNFASLHNLPVIFFIENNLYSVYTSLKERQPKRPLTAYAQAHVMRATEVNGNDVLAVRSVTEEFVGEARLGKGPGLIVAETYRWLEHCGPNYDNDLGYREKSELLRWQKRCPLDKFRKKLRQERILDDSTENRLTREIDSEVMSAFSSAQSAPFPDPSSAKENVYA